MAKVLQLQTPEWAVPLMNPSRYKGAWGGRGSGKSHFFAELMIEAHIMDQKRRSVCVREIQKSLNQSVKRLLETKIEAMNAGAYFEVQDAGSQWVSRLVAPRRGDLVIDFCAGAGGKTLAIGAQMKNTGRIVALDTSEPTQFEHYAMPRAR